MRKNEGRRAPYGDEVGNLPNRLRALWLNPELAKKNPRCLENIVVGAVTYLIERTHTERFVELVDRHIFPTGEHAETNSTTQRWQLKTGARSDD